VVVAHGLGLVAVPSWGSTPGPGVDRAFRAPIAVILR